MSIVDDQVRRYDALLDKYQLTLASSRKSSIDADSLAPTSTRNASRVAKLKSVIRSLSTAASSRPVIRRERLRRVLAEMYSDDDDDVTSQTYGENTDLLWLAAGKATVQLYGTALDSLLGQTIPLSESIWYWDDVLGSHIKTGLYMLQTSPIRMWNTGKDVWKEAKQRYQSSVTIRDAAEHSRQTLTDGWREFYGLVQDSFRDRSLLLARTRILSPFALSRTEAKHKQERLKKLQQQGATAIGMLVDEGLTFPRVEFDDDDEVLNHDWRATIARSVTLLENVLHHSRSVDTRAGEYEYTVIDALDHAEPASHPRELITLLVHILDTHLPDQERSSGLLAAEYGLPPRWVRYWIPGLVLFLSGSTLLRIFANRRAAIMTWVHDLGQTTIDFWYNWILEPTKKLIGTIRHDKNSELAIMSRDSLKSDRDSLERMVVDFAVEHPEGGRKYNESEIADLRNRVREGDLTPVLRAYEQDMKSPVVRAITGNLIRTLLIQIQKTKVDVEVAIGGIDSLLKSQELLFGFVGVAPGILFAYFVGQWLRNVLGGRKGLQAAKQQGETLRLLRNIDRILANSQQASDDILTYKDHGLLICEVHVLRRRASRILPGQIQRDFLEDINDLLDVRQGITKQKAIVERIYRAYAKWLR